MSVKPIRRGWRGEAAGIPPVRVLVPAAASRSAAVPTAPPPPPPLPAAAERRADPPANGPDPEFPLWPATTTTLALHEAPHPEGAHAQAEEAGELEAAHAAGRTAVEDHLAGLPDQWPPPAMRAMRQPRDDRRSAPQRRRRQRRVKPARSAGAGLSAMLGVALLTLFFAWTSAEPFWLDMGRGVRGTAEITSCHGSGVLRRCLAEFTRPGHEPVPGTRLMGLDGPAGTTVAAQMVPGGRIAYAGNPTGLRVRWAAGAGLIVLCGITLAWLTGAWRFNRLRDRLVAWALTAAAPLVLAAAVVVAAY
ncbi:hypothetical protein Dvina_04495 [Dactylosporangium vinaceum]|uniref:Uncharacterized protein n=1 Tax=Dactylosporangium vinaceum TaxID=53362 RepID=A0ABV5MHY2_9ACTN|nr:hypothetical protein [Dactylosporangium vinaceum]UAB97440.1 hypothetical protein Dvina_04495 [Dactylosporangium vinaceum]